MSDHPHRALLPAGFHDLLPPDAAYEASVVERLIGMFASRGYERVKPPLVEFEETLLGGAGATLSKDMFRVMDPISQRMMALRADMTLQVARIADARLTRHPRPLRLSYAGQVLRVRGSDLRPERQFGQVGVELIGPDLAEADAEVVCVATEALAAAGIRHLSVDLNLPSLVPAVTRALQAPAEDSAILRHALDRKDAATVAGVGGAAAALLGPLLACGGPAAEALQAAQALPLPDEARALVRRLGDVVDRVSSALPGLMVTADLVEHRGFEYHRGVSFTIFARGVRGELGRGGRYRIGDVNNGEAATGVTLFTDTVLRAAPTPAPPRRIFLPHGTAGQDGARLREAGWVTVAGLSPVDGAVDEARRLGCGHVFLDGEIQVLAKDSGLMANVAVVGAQWGDEGKGKIVDWLSSRAQVVVRFQGGHNAGHTLVIGDKTYKLSLLPSGIVRPGKLSVIGNGVVVDPWALLQEIDTLRGMGVEISPENLLLAENATLILPVHGAVDRAREAAKGDRRIGTTGRGIGPAYEDKVARRAIRVCDLDDRALLETKVDDLLLHHNALLRGLGAEEINRQWFLDQLATVADKILPYAGVVWNRLDAMRREGQRILFEGAQGAMLDVDHGTYPFVTSSNTVAASAATGSGMGPGAIDFVLGITKAYTTRVGAGPFPTEQDNEVGRLLGERGHEFGTVTGRRRRCGWFDAVMVRQAIKTGGIDGIALTKLDVLDGFDTLRICVGYRCDGKIIHHLPASQARQREIEPVYEPIEGWRESTRGARSWADLPAMAIKYVRRIEELIEAPVALLSTSPERDDTVLVHDPFAD